MKKIFSTRYSTSVVDVWLLMMRIAAGCFMLTHGLPKFEKLISGNTTFSDPLGVGATTSLILTVFAEVFCSIFLIMGFATRLASFFLMFTMAVAGFYIHWASDFGKKEIAFLYLLIFITMFVFGAGKYSMDYLLGHRRGSKRYY